MPQMPGGAPEGFTPALFAQNRFCLILRMVAEDRRMACSTDARSPRNDVPLLMQSRYSIRFVVRQGSSRVVVDPDLKADRLSRTPRIDRNILVH
jgi:hypothetical protein